MTTDSSESTTTAARPGRARRSLARVLYAVFAGWVLFGCVGIWLNLEQRSLLQRFQADPFSVTLSEARANDNRADSLNSAGVMLVIATGVAFAAWLFLEHRRAERLGADTTFRSGWAIGGWVIPIANLYIPYRVTADVWNGTAGHAASRVHREAVGQPNDRPNLVPCWWGVVLLNGFLAVRAGNAADEAQNVNTALKANVWFLGRSGAFILAGVMSILVVRAISGSRGEGQPAVADTPDEEFWGRREVASPISIELNEGEQ